jgi:hypothetical protein
MSILGACGAMALEIAYLQAVSRELQGVADAAAHAAVLSLDGTTAGLATAQREANALAQSTTVRGQRLRLSPSDITFGRWDATTRQFVPTTDPARVTTVRVAPTVADVGLSLGTAFLGEVFDVSACGLVTEGDGSASTGVIGGPGLKNGHFNVGTARGAWDCEDWTIPNGDHWSPNPARDCAGYYNEVIGLDDRYETTTFDAFRPRQQEVKYSWRYPVLGEHHSEIGGAFGQIDRQNYNVSNNALFLDHFPIHGCTDIGGFPRTCGIAGAEPVIGPQVAFVLQVVNPDLSPGGRITVNGVTSTVQDYGQIPPSALTRWSLGGTAPGTQRLSELKIWFPIDSIASCQLHPTTEAATRDNVLGVGQVWRNGALTVQAVTPGAASRRSRARSAGGHAPVANQVDGLLWESYFYWAWEAGIPYTTAREGDWRAAYDALECGGPTFIDTHGTGAGGPC